MSDDQKLVYDDLQGPSWSREKKIKNPLITENKENESKGATEDLNVSSVKQATKDSVRAIMLIRAYRIRGHLIANLDPLAKKRGTSRTKA